MRRSAATPPQTPTADAAPEQGRLSRSIASAFRNVSRLVALACAVAGAVIFLNFGSIPAWLAPYAVPLVIGVVAIFTAARWWRAGLRRELSRTAAGKVREFGGGIYGTVALLTWLWLEASDLFQDFVLAGGLLPFLRAVNLADMVADAIRFAIAAALWPFHWFDATLALTVLLAVALVDTVVPPVLRFVRRRLSPTEPRPAGRRLHPVDGGWAGAGAPLASSEEKP